MRLGLVFASWISSRLFTNTVCNITSILNMQVKKLTEFATIPARGSAYAAGFDLSSAYDIIIPKGGKAIVKTDIAIAIPQNTYARIAPRSGLAVKNFIDVGAGVVDYDYRGNVGVVLFNHGDADFVVARGDRVAQLVLERISMAAAKEVQDLPDTARGAGGFGSTGVTDIVLVKKLTDLAIAPTRGSKFAAGFDLSSAYDIVVPKHGKAIVKTDLAIAIPENTYARVAPRSGLAVKNFIDVGAGVVDYDYRGNVGVVLFNHGDADFVVARGDRVAQLVLERISMAPAKEVQDLPDTARGAGGFGSTGVAASVTGNEAAQEGSPKRQRIEEGSNAADELVLVKKLTDLAILPIRGSAHAAGFDLSSAYDIVVPKHGKAIVKTDLAIAIPENTYARVAPRSGLAVKNFIDVGAGVVDYDYRGNVGVVLFNHGDADFVVARGDRVAQLVLERISMAAAKEVQDLPDTARGAGGFGSTGVAASVTAQNLP